MLRHCRRRLECLSLNPPGPSRSSPLQSNTNLIHPGADVISRRFLWLGGFSALQREVDADRAAQQPQPVQPELAPQPEQVQPQPTNGVDPEVAKALSNEKVRAAINEQIQQSEIARQQYVAAIQQMGQVASANLLANFPELQGVTQQSFPQVLQAINARDPARAQAIVSHVQAAGQHMQALQQQAEQYQAAVAQQTRAQIDHWDSDDEAVKNDPDIKRIKSEIVNVAKTHYGISEKDLRHAWQNETWIHHPAVQAMMTDAVRYRLARQGAGKARATPVSRVMRPGEVNTGGASYDPQLSEAAAAFRELPNPRNAARQLSALRRARANQR